MIFINDSFAKMLKGGVIMEVSTVEQALLAEKSGACAVMALDVDINSIRKQRVCRMANIKLIESIKKAVSIPVMSKCRIGHTLEAKILEKLEIDFIDENEALTAADNSHINKNKFNVPFVCGAKNLGEALRRIYEGATMIRTTGETETGDIKQAVLHFKQIKSQINYLKNTSIEEKINFCYKEKVNMELLNETIKYRRLPVVTFAAGGIATPADAALMMNLGADGIFLGIEVFESSYPESIAQNIVKSTTYFDKPDKLLEICRNDVSVRQEYIISS